MTPREVYQEATRLDVLASAARRGLANVLEACAAAGVIGFPAVSVTERAIDCLTFRVNALKATKAYRHQARLAEWYRQVSHSYNGLNTDQQLRELRERSRGFVDPLTRPLAERHQRTVERAYELVCRAAEHLSRYWSQARAWARDELDPAMAYQICRVMGWHVADLLVYEFADRDKPTGVIVAVDETHAQVMGRNKGARRSPIEAVKAKRRRGSR